jgi:hypothetical protein
MSVSNELGHNIPLHYALSSLVDAGWAYYASGMMGPLGCVLEERIERKFAEIELRFASLETKPQSQQPAPAPPLSSFNSLSVYTELATMLPPSLSATLPSIGLQASELPVECLLSRARRMHAARVNAFNRLSRPKIESPFNIN